jgi:hypothetical protein
MQARINKALKNLGVTDSFVLYILDSPEIFFLVEARLDRTIVGLTGGWNL